MLTTVPVFAPPLPLSTGELWGLRFRGTASTFEGQALCLVKAGSDGHACATSVVSARMT